MGSTPGRLDPTAPPPAAAHGTLGIGLLGDFRLWTADGPMAVEATGSQRLIAFLALRDRAMTRKAVAGILWPDVSEARAHASLRSALMRLQGPARLAVITTFVDIELAPWVEVDIRDARARAHRILAPAGTCAPGDIDEAAIASLAVDLLPDWYEDWVLVETEEWRQLRLHALEALAGHLVAASRFGAAAGAALAAIRAEPLRESAHAALIRIHLAEGNQSEALTAYERYRRLLGAELGLEPTSRLTELIAGLQHP